jgi:hypothetical protein
MPFDKILDVFVRHTPRTTNAIPRKLTAVQPLSEPAHAVLHVWRENHRRDLVEGIRPTAGFVGHTSYVR